MINPNSSLSVHAVKGGLRSAALSLLVLLLISSCGPSEDEPVEINSGDTCSFCGMTIKKPVLASEIIFNGKVYKFDDLACLDAFKTKNRDKIRGTAYAIDFASRKWVRYDAATIVATDIVTPMGSGLLAFADSAKANAFARTHAPRKAM